MRTLLPLALGLAILLCGCSKLTTENYDKLKTGMAYDEVKTLLGAPDQCSDVLLMKQCTWGNERRNIAISFVADKVVLSSAHNLN